MRRKHVITTVVILTFIVFALVLMSHVILKNNDLDVNIDSIIINRSYKDNDNWVKKVSIYSCNTEGNFVEADMTDKASYLIKLKSGGYCGLLNENKLCFMDSDFSEKKTIPLGFDVFDLYEMSESVFVRCLDGKCYIINESDKINELSINLDIERVKLCSNGETVAYLTDNKIYTYDGESLNSYSVTEGYMLNGIIEGSTAIVSKTLFGGLLLEIKSFDLKSGNTIKRFILSISNNYINYASISEGGKYIVLFSVNDSGVLNTYYIDYNKRAYKQTSIDTDCIDYVQLVKY